MGTTGKTLCDADSVAWTEETARLIRERHFHEIDLEHLADEIQHLGKNQRDAARSQLQRMLLHLIRQRIQPERPGSSRRSSITSARAEIEPKLESSPSLKRYLEASLERIYESAVRDAIYEMRISHSRAGGIPAACPWTLDELLEGKPE